MKKIIQAVKDKVAYEKETYRLSQELNRERREAEQQAKKGGKS